MKNSINFQCNSFNLRSNLRNYLFMHSIFQKLHKPCKNNCNENFKTYLQTTDNFCNWPSSIKNALLHHSISTNNRQNDETFLMKPQICDIFRRFSGFPDLFNLRAICLLFWKHENRHSGEFSVVFRRITWRLTVISANIIKAIKYPAVLLGSFCDFSKFLHGSAYSCGWVLNINFWLDKLLNSFIC